MILMINLLVLLGLGGFVSNLLHEELSLNKLEKLVKETMAFVSKLYTWNLVSSSKLT